MKQSREEYREERESLGAFGGELFDDAIGFKCTGRMAAALRAAAVARGVDVSFLMREISKNWLLSVDLNPPAVVENTCTSYKIPYV